MFKINDAMLGFYLKKPFWSLVILTSIFFAAGYLISVKEAKVFEEESVQESRLLQVQEEVNFLKNQEKLFALYGKKYKYFIERGLVSKQDRVKWTDGLLKIGNDNFFKPLDILFEPEQKLTSQQVKHLVIEKDIFYYTRLNITAGMYTDTDVIMMLKRINNEITPLYLVDKCEMITDILKLKDPVFIKGKPMFKVKCSIILFQSKPAMFNAKKFDKEVKGEIDPADIH